MFTIFSGALNLGVAISEIVVVIKVRLLAAEQEVAATTTVEESRKTRA